MTDLDRLLAAVGVADRWRDADGVDQLVSRDAVLAILDALGWPAWSDAVARDSLARHAEAATSVTFASADVGERVTLPPAARPGAATIVFENGERRATIVEAAAGVPGIAGIEREGYHRLEHDGVPIELAIAPRRCFAPPAGRHWGAAVQIPALRGSAGGEFGDFVALAEAARAFGRRGAAMLAINPVHALFPADASRFSPYSPSSRSFLNGLMASPGAGEAIGEAAGAGPALIAWDRAIPDRLAALRAAYERRTGGGLAAFVESGGAGLERHALFDALHAHFFASSGAQGWQQWPAAFHDPGSPAVAAFAAERRDEIDFHAFLQWRANADLGAAQAAARDSGMAIGLIADLAVGMDAGGSHGWSRRDELLPLKIGAPPDPLGPTGQDWGIAALDPAALRRTGFAAFRDTLRAALAHAGGLRIDHALGLSRLWVIPAGAGAGEGAYLGMPLHDLLRIVAIESHRHRAIVIGEDLGTVPPGFRDIMRARGLLGMAVLPFERGEGGFTPAGQWPAGAVAMTATHDTPTLAGWWRGNDLGWRARIEGHASAQIERDEAARAEDRAALWRAIGDGSAAPADPAPVVDAAIAFVAATQCPLIVVPFEDLLGVEEQPNLPGTTTEHPNWRRRAAAETETLLDDPAVERRIATLNRITPS
ncbi:MAG TPA: 4-alpha-glucanotransferase [Sphingomonas sp.]|nr:4-alpha-glucanotransferase [Sphingomonas sp.]